MARSFHHVTLMQVDSHRGTEAAGSAEELIRLISQFDSRGGGEYWLARAGEKHPCLAIHFTGDHADVHWFGDDQGTVYRCLRPEGSAELDGDYTMFIFEHCDPYEGEAAPNEFVITRDTAFEIARSFFDSTSLPAGFPWFEL